MREDALTPHCSSRNSETFRSFFYHTDVTIDCGGFRDKFRCDVFGGPVPVCHRKGYQSSTRRPHVRSHVLRYAFIATGGCGSSAQYSDTLGFLASCLLLAILARSLCAGRISRYVRGCLARRHPASLFSVEYELSDEPGARKA